LRQPPMTPPSVLDPLLLARVGDLELVARTIVDGLRSGPHRSPFHGYSAEFSQYRHYRPGDDLKYVDWKLAARTDRIYTKQFRETTDLAAALVLDCSGSMGFTGIAPVTDNASAVAGASSGGSSETLDKTGGASGAAAADGAAGAAAAGAGAAKAGAGAARGDMPRMELSKLRYASMAAAALAYVIADQGDAVGMLAFQGTSLAYVPPRTGQHHLRGLLATLSGLQAREMSMPHVAIRRASEMMRRRGLIMIFSDFYDQEQQTLAEIRRCVRIGHDVAVFQVMSRAEIEFPYRGDTEFEDLESGQRVVTHANDVKHAYKDQLSAFLERWRTHARGEGVDYTLLVTDTALDEGLREFLLRRSARRAG
jgi:uncharacterized protein (DUF58 family)